MEPISMVKTAGTVLSVLGGLFGKKEKPAPPAVNLAKMREQAVANGFNPLTVLRQTGGLGFNPGQVAPRPSPFSIIGAGLSDFGGIMADNQYRQMGREAHEMAMELGRSQIDAFNRPQRAASRTSTVTTIQKPRENELFPLNESRFADTAIEDIPYWKVRSLGGDTFQIRADVLERLRVAEGSTMIVEDWEALLGELGGEFEGIGTIIKGGLGMNQSDFFLTTGMTPQAIGEPMQPATVVPKARPSDVITNPDWLTKPPSR